MERQNLVQQLSGVLSFEESLSCIERVVTEVEVICWVVSWGVDAGLSLCRPVDDRPLYPYQNVGTTSPRDDDGSAPRITLQESFNFFGQNYSQIFLNNNGDLTFDAPWSSYIPEQFPRHGGRDIIAPFWTDLDNRVNGDIRYVQYSNGPVLQQVSNDINVYFPDLSFHANWVFIATWENVAYFNENGKQTTFQVVLTTDGQFSFVLMNYGSIANTSKSVQAGYDTADSSHHFSIPGSMTNNAVGSNSFFSLHSNVNVPGRWVFRVDQGSTGCNYNGKNATAPWAERPTPLTTQHFPFRAHALTFYPSSVRITCPSTE
uniref:NIDO domain-containing protein n=1 Tax=Fundulus heteroclitus TaxID=8078 RepID=A0A3Q2PFA0_FUNHE